MVQFLVSVHNQKYRCSPIGRPALLHLQIAGRYVAAFWLRRILGFETDLIANHLANFFMVAMWVSKQNPRYLPGFPAQTLTSWPHGHCWP